MSLCLLITHPSPFVSAVRGNRNRTCEPPISKCKLNASVANRFENLQLDLGVSSPLHGLDRPTVSLIALSYAAKLLTRLRQEGGHPQLSEHSHIGYCESLTLPSLLKSEMSIRTQHHEISSNPYSWHPKPV